MFLASFDYFSVSNTTKEGILQPVVSLCNIPSNKDTQKDDTDATSEEEKKEMTILIDSLQLDGKYYLALHASISR